MIKGINDDGFINRLGRGASNTIFHVDMTIIKFLPTLFDCMSIASSKRVRRLGFWGWGADGGIYVHILNRKKILT